MVRHELTNTQWKHLLKTKETSMKKSQNGLTHPISSMFLHLPLRKRL